MRTGHPARICVIGGGFSGTLVLANLVAQAREHCIIELFEAKHEFGIGTAYATREPYHLLNVQAGRMGARKASDFVAWLEMECGLAARARLHPESAASTDDYLPRSLYGQYLKDLLGDVLFEASLRGISVRVTRAAVTDLSVTRDGIEATCERKGTRMRASFDAAILATGNSPPRAPAFIAPVARRAERYVANLWDADAVSRLPDARTCSRKAVLILGTGLTAIDAILALETRGFGGRIIAVSRNGRPPEAHVAGTRPGWTFAVAPGQVRPSASAILAWLRREAEQAQASRVDWRSVLDAARPFAHALWHRLDVAERRRIMRRLSWWNVHRHRMAPAVAERIEALRRDGKLDVRAARVLTVQWRPGGFAVRMRRGRESETMRASWILNCMGPEYDVAASAEPLLKNLLRKGLVVRSPAGGIAARDKGVAAGRNDGRIFAIGPLLIGELFETTAVPELRELAKHVAGLVRARLIQGEEVPG